MARASDYEACFTGDPLAGFMDAVVSDVPLTHVMPGILHTVESLQVETLPPWSVGPVGDDPRVWEVRTMRGNDRTVIVMSHAGEVFVDLYDTDDEDVVVAEGPYYSVMIGVRPESPLSPAEYARLMAAMLLVRYVWLDSISAASRHAAVRRRRAASAPMN